MEITLEVPKTESRLIQLIGMGKSIRQRWVNIEFETVCSSVFDGYYAIDKIEQE